MQIPEIERMLDDLEAAANMVEEHGAGAALPWHVLLGAGAPSPAFVSLTPAETRRLVTIARKALRRSLTSRAPVVGHA